MSASPMHHFEVAKVLPLTWGPVDISFTDSALVMSIAVLTIMVSSLLCLRNMTLVPGRAQMAVEVVYQFIAKLLRSAAGKKGMRFLPFVLSLFSFILATNLLSMFPYFAAPTGQIIITFTMAVLVISTVVISGLFLNGSRFFRTFVPSGVPTAILPLVCAIEIVSFCARMVSLSVRLFANILAGHLTLQVFSGFVVAMFAIGSAAGALGSVLPLSMVVAMTGLELLVAFLQAYVFTLLTCMYLKDAVSPGH